MCYIWELNLVATVPAEEESGPIFCVQIMFSNASAKEEWLQGLIQLIFTKSQILSKSVCLNLLSY